MALEESVRWDAFILYRSCSIMLHLREPVEILSTFLFHSPEQKEHLCLAFNSVMPDNIQFIYGKLIKIHRAGLLVYALISLNQQTIYSALMYSSCRALLPSSHVTSLTLVLMHANKQ